MASRKPQYNLEQQPKPVYEAEPLPGEKAPETFGVHPHSVYEKARINSMRTGAEDEFAMKQLQKVTKRITSTKLPENAPVEEDSLPGFYTTGALFKKPQAASELPPVEHTSSVIKGADWAAMTSEERGKALAAQGTRQTVPNPEAAPRDKSAKISRSAYLPMDTLQLNRDEQAKASTGLDIPAPKPKKIGLRAAIKKVAEQVANRHYTGPDIKAEHGSALAYFKKTFTKTGSDDEVDEHVRSNYSHMLPEEYQTNRAPLSRGPKPAQSSSSSKFVKNYASNPLSAFRGK